VQATRTDLYARDGHIGVDELDTKPESFLARSTSCSISRRNKCRYFLTIPPFSIARRYSLHAFEKLDPAKITRQFSLGKQRTTVPVSEGKKAHAKETDVKKHEQKNVNSERIDSITVEYSFVFFPSFFFSTPRNRCVGQIFKSERSVAVQGRGEREARTRP